MGLDKWIKDNYKSLNLKTQRFNWINEILPGFYDYQCTIQTGLGEFVGRGIADSEEVAFHKSFVEAIERWTCKHNGIESTGVALHTKEEDADYISFLEALERYGAEHVFNNNVQVHELPKHDIRVASNLNFDRLNGMGIGLRVFYFSFSTFMIFFAEAEVSSANRPKKRFLGLGLKPSHRASFLSAMTEALLNATAYADGDTRVEKIKMPAFWNERVSLSYLGEPSPNAKSFGFSVGRGEPLTLPINIPLYGFRNELKASNL